MTDQQHTGTSSEAVDVAGGLAQVTDPHPPPPDLRAAEPSADDATTQPEVSLDLDTLEREKAPKQFIFRHLGARYLLVDPQEVDWQDLIPALGDPYPFFRT